MTVLREAVRRRPRPTLRIPAEPVRRSYSWLRGSPAGLNVLALGVGAGAGAGAVLFRYLILEFTRLFSGYNDYSAAGHAPNPMVPQLGMWFVMLAPIVGGVIYGVLIARLALRGAATGAG